MSLQHHFVVVVEDGKLTIETDITYDRFDNASIWNTEIETWESDYDHSRESEKAMELLWDRLNFGYDHLVKNLLDSISEMRSTGDYDDETLEAIEWRFSHPEGEDRILPYKKENA
jgi:hypothetical protein